MKNILKNNYLTTISAISITLLSLSGCAKDPKLNHKPVVTLPSNKTVTINEPLKLTAKVVDRDKEDILTYIWKIAAKPKDSNLTLKNNRRKTLLFQADTSGTYYLDFTANDTFTNSDPKRVVILVSSLLGEWRADLTKTKEENRLNDEEKIEVAELLSANYKFTFFENGTVEGKENSSWKHIQNENYKLDDKELKLIDANHFFVMGKLKDKELKLYYKRVLKK